MYSLAILAQAAEAGRQTAQAEKVAEEVFVPVNFIWEQIIALNLVEALTFICFGVVCLLYGLRVFKILVIISFALIGLFVGVWTNKLLIGGNEIWLGVICMAIFAFLSVPLMRWAVSILGAAAGGILTGGGWYAVGLPEQYIVAGVIIGVVAGGMISFIIFKVAVVLFTSLGGSVLMAVGVLALLYLYPQTKEWLEQMVFAQKWFLPAALAIPTAVGLFVQNKLIQGAKNWNIR